MRDNLENQLVHLSSTPPPPLSCAKFFSLFMKFGADPSVSPLDRAYYCGNQDTYTSVSYIVFFHGYTTTAMGLIMPVEMQPKFILRKT